MYLCRSLITTLLLAQILSLSVRAEPVVLEASQRRRSSSSSSPTADPSDPSTSPSPAAQAATPQAEAAGTPTADSAQTSPYTHLYVNTAKPGPGGSHLTDTVFKAEALQPPFNSCVIAKKSNSSTCFKDDAYNDRLTFQLTFNYPPSHIGEAFEETPPRLKVRDRRGLASPEITTARVDGTTSMAEVTVQYNCQPGSSGAIGLKLVIRLLKDSKDKLTIQWRKTCASGVHDKLAFGFLSTDVAGTTEHHSFGTDAAASVVVGPADASTEWYMKLLQPGAQQAFLAPYITSSDPDSVGVSVRGNHPNGGVISGLVDTKLQISYECAKKGDSTIRATVGIPPFDNITAEWTKDCGGKTPRNLQVGTTLNGFDIVDDGKPTPRYMVGIDDIGTPHSEAHLHLHPNESDWTFYIRNNDTMPGAGATDTAMHVGHITSTVGKQHVLVPVPAEVYAKTPLGWRRMEQAPYPLSAGATLRVKLHLVCRQRGDSRILITVPVLGYKELEFGIAKECEHGGMSYTSSEFVLTVGDVFLIAIGLIVLSGACLYVRRRRASKVAFKPLPTEEH